MSITTTTVHNVSEKTARLAASDVTDFAEKIHAMVSAALIESKTRSLSVSNIS
jgi:hypothetical protein